MSKRPQIGLLVKGWTCPCGCALQLDQYQVGDEQRLIALLGEKPHDGVINLRGSAGPRVSRVDPPEPTRTGECRACGGDVELPTFLADFLKLRGAPWPLCEACVKGRQVDLWSAA